MCTRYVFIIDHVYYIQTCSIQIYTYSRPSLSKGSATLDATQQPNQEDQLERWPSDFLFLRIRVQFPAPS